MTVLIVDDNSAVRRLLRRALQTVATEVWECDNGMQALDRYRECHPTWVLMDVNMPKMDGITATGLIRRLDQNARIIIVTDFDDEETRTAARNAGAEGFLSKQDLTSLADFLRDPNELV